MKAVLSVLALAILSPFAHADLSPGSPAPALSVRKWYKGAPIGEIGKSGTYVVEFWGPGCGPCIDVIPHLTETAHKNPDVTIIGVSIWEDDKDGHVKRFVDNMGGKMDYHVGYSGNQDGMAKTWMKAASLESIPTAFIVKNGVIQWIGHPMSMEKPLEEVKAGTFDVSAFKAEFDKQMAEKRRRLAVDAEVSHIITLFDNGKRVEAHRKLDDLVSKNPDLAERKTKILFQWLSQEDPKAWDIEAVKVANSKSIESLQMLCTFALEEASKPTPNVKVVRRSIELALSSTEKPVPLALQYGVMVYEQLKDYPQALKLADQFLKVVPAIPETADFRSAMEKKKAEMQAKSR